jgi:cyclic pyranopterin phosphate synthase
MSVTAAPEDRLGRPLHDLRVSLTDRCNFRCTYCMPKAVFGAGYRFMPRADLLSFEELERVVSLFVPLGVRKLRLTGGEPLLRRDVEHLIGRLAALEGIDDVCLTTNGSLLTPERAKALAEAGLSRVTVSLDALDPTVFGRMNDVGFPVSRVLAGIDHARAAGLDPVKVNMVVRRGVNDAEIIAMARHFRGSGVVLRFIEFMDVGATNGWRLDEVVPSREVIARLAEHWPLEPVDPNYPGEVAERWRYTDGGGEIGVISSVTQPFCRGCSRARLSADGKLFTCLFGAAGHDLRAQVRSGLGDDDIRAWLAAIWRGRGDRYSEQRSEHTVTGPRVEMSYIGG